MIFLTETTHAESKNTASTSPNFTFCRAFHVHDTSRQNTEKASEQSKIDYDSTENMQPDCARNIDFYGTNTEMNLSNPRKN